MAVTCTNPSCDKVITDRSVSPDFCSHDCQHAWHSRELGRVESSTTLGLSMGLDKPVGLDPRADPAPVFRSPLVALTALANAHCAP